METALRLSLFSHDANVVAHKPSIEPGSSINLFSVFADIIYPLVELTQGVTEHTSGLIDQQESGKNIPAFDSKTRIRNKYTYQSTTT